MAKRDANIPVSLSREIRKLVNESECTYGEAVGVLTGLADEYRNQFRNLKVKQAPYTPAAER